MSPLRWWRLVALAAISTVVCWALLVILARRGGAPVPVPVLAPVLLALLAVLVLVLARAVWRSARGRTRRPVPPLTAFRIAVLATAAAWAGPALVGWYAAQALVIWPELVGERATRFWLAVAGACAAVLLTGAGVLGRRWCRRPPSDPDPSSADDGSGA